MLVWAHLRCVPSLESIAQLYVRKEEEEQEEEKQDMSKEQGYNLESPRSKLSSKSNQHFLNFLQYSAKHHSVFYPPFPTMYSYYTAYLIPDIPSPIFKHVLLAKFEDPGLSN